MVRNQSWGSPIRWAGSKRKLIPYLKRFLESDFDRLIEPFCGSASLFFSQRPRKALLNDANAELINALHVLRATPVALLSSLKELPANETTYYSLRRSSLVDKFDLAVRFFYLNRFCFNGIYRTNRKGEFNVPYGRNGTGDFPSLDRWKDCSALLANAELTNLDFEQLCELHVRPGDFVFLDPPYFIRERRVFSEYTKSLFDEVSQSRLASVMHLIHEKGARFVLTYERGEESDDLSAGWTATTKSVARTVAGSIAKRVSVDEVFVSNDKNAVRRIARMD